METKNQNNEFVKCIAAAIGEYLKLTPDAKIEGDKIYKLSMKVWFDLENGNVKSISTSEVDFSELNKSLNKKYRGIKK